MSGFFTLAVLIVVVCESASRFLSAVARLRGMVADGLVSSSWRGQMSVTSDDQLARLPSDANELVLSSGRTIGDHVRGGLIYLGDRWQVSHRIGRPSL